MHVHIVLPSSPWLADSKTNIPLGPLYVASVLRNADHHVTITSRLGQPLQSPITFSDEALDADVHMVSCCTPQFNEALAIAAAIKDARPHAILIAGGPHPTYEPLEVRTAVRQASYHTTAILPTRRVYSGPGAPLFDTIVSGEGEGIVLPLLDDLAHGRLQPFYDGNAHLLDVNRISYPAWDLLPADHIHNDGAAVMKQAYFPGGVMSLIGSRGCPFHCTFCSGPRIGLKPRFRSPENILGEMQQVIQRFNVRQFKFQDDTMTCDKPHLAQLARTLQAGLAGEPFVARIHTRVNVMSETVASYLTDMSCKVTCFGFESGAQAILNRANKRTSVAQGTSALEIAKAAGFTTIGFLVFGLPGETEATTYATMDWLTSVRPLLDSVNLAVAIPYPGSQLWREPETHGVQILDYNYDHFWIVGFASRDSLLLRPMETDLPTMLRLKREMFQFLCDQAWAKPEWADDARILKDEQSVNNLTLE